MVAHDRRMTFIGRLAILLITVTIGAGCMKVQTVSRPLSRESIDAINESGRADPRLTIDLLPGVPPLEPPQLEVKALANGDQKQMTFVGLSGELRSIESARVRSVRVSKRGPGALMGLVGGALGGAAAGGMLGSNGWFSTGERMVMGGAICGLVGLLIGAAAGEQTVYVFEDRL